ncbi:Cbb3-type cytochrome c oxidase subunit CcoP [Tsuneonella dongtanensis]|uniref:Cbb3-type cytochrome c oxidase subunit n=1 Tax=Tsuneonella dongtanensis TaxID=692370 RepID=A0A1B2ABU2_9SPHN|nr:cytochrome-c oxidase, cbb3-type subunit III [Tsuneonella dongtanensis]ANY19630.1 Cbb3-type cytochrome c oxidase subunit CcoP [Tsuneonella dongtanensis]
MANERPDAKRIDEPTGTEFVGHEWDGIEELDTPMPRWWLWTFYLTIAWALVYVVLYPALPLLSKGTEGVLGWTSRGQLAQQMSLADQGRRSVGEALAATDIAKLEGKPDLLRQAVAGGKAAFRVHCTQCHGSGAAGSQTLGYPNLNDDDWLWGGDLATIEYTITHGIRQPGEDKRQGAMPPFEGVFDTGQLTAISNHVLSLSGKARSNALGASLFADNCTVCHGANGEGDRTQGAPRLNDAIWLYGGTREDVAKQILRPRMGAMPAFKDKLDPVTIKMLAAYVHSLGGGEATIAEPAPPAAKADGEQ